MISKNKKKILTIVCIVLGVFVLNAQSLNRTIDNTTYEYDDVIKITGDKSSVISEEAKLSPGIKISVDYFKEYNQAIFRINTRYDKYSYDESDTGVFFKNFIETWIRDKSHRYYSYQVDRRNTFYSRKDKDGNKIIQNEYKVILYKH